MDRVLLDLPRLRDGRLMRPVYVCMHCGVHYLPPEGMVYPTSGVQASPVRCENPACVTAASTMPPLPPALLARIEEQAQPGPATRARRGAHGRRAAAAPAGGRNKLR